MKPLPSLLHKLVLFTTALSTAVGPVLAQQLRYQVPMQAVSSEEAPAGELQLSPALQDFGTVIEGSAVARSLTLRNTGGQPVALSPTSVSGTAFSQTNNCLASLPGGAGCTVNVFFAPPNAGSYSGALDIAGDVGTVSTELQGQALAASRTLHLSTAAVDFGEVNVGTSSGDESPRTDHEPKTGKARDNTHGQPNVASDIAAQPVSRAVAANRAAISIWRRGGLSSDTEAPSGAADA